MKNVLIGISYGNSMAPLITANNKLHIYTTKSVSLGDIVVFYRQKKLISHRLIRFKNNHLITKGDNSPFTDGIVMREEIVGKVILIQTNKKTLNLQSKTATAVKYYFLFCSLCQFYGPIVLYKFIGKLFVGRKFLKNLLTT